MAKSQFGPAGTNITRSYKSDAAIGAGLAVIDGASVNSVALPSGANVRALGVTALASVNAGDAISVVELGEVTAVADAAITRHQWVMINAITGQLAPIGATPGLNYEVVGLALEAAVAQGDEFLLFVLPLRVHGLIDSTTSPTFVGLTLTGLLKESVLGGVVALAGGGQAGATPLTASLNRVATVATPGDSVLLPASAAGLVVAIDNRGANPCQVFGTGVDTINGIATATGISQGVNTIVVYYCLAAGNWEIGLTGGTPEAFSTLGASGAVPAHTTHNYVITKAGVAALTLAAPTVTTDDGVVISLMSSTTNAHTLTATGLLQTGSASVNVATFAAFGGAGLTLMAYQGKWIVQFANGITFS